MNDLSPRRGPFDRRAPIPGVPTTFGSAGTSQPSMLVYISTPAQTVLSLSNPDHYGNSYRLTASYPIQVSVNGLRFIQDDGSGFGDYTINLDANSITFLEARGAGQNIVIDTASPLPVPSGEIPISQLPLAGPLFGDEMVPIVQNGITCRTTSLTGKPGPQGPQGAHGGFGSSLYYTAASQQTVFPVATPDLFGQTGVLLNNDILVYGNGTRLTPTVDYTVDTGGNRIVFTRPWGAGTSVIIDISSSAVLNDAIISATLYYSASAAQAVFFLNTADIFGNNATLTSNQILVYRGGNRMTPGADYTISIPGNSVTFTYPPALGEDIVFDLTAPPPSAILPATTSLKMEVLPITTLNVLPAVTYAPDGNLTMLFVSGTVFFPIGPDTAFTVSGRVLTWTSTIYSVPVGAAVIAVYTHA